VALSRRALLAGLLVATGGCGLSAKAPIGVNRVRIRRRIIVSSALQLPTVSSASGEPDGGAATSGAGDKFGALITAFNTSQTAVSAEYGPEYATASTTDSAATMVTPNPSVSAWIGAPPGVAGIDLTGNLRQWNVDVEGFLPGTMASVTDAKGALTGLPIGVSIVSLAYSPTALRQSGLNAPSADGWTLAEFVEATSACATQFPGQFGADLGFGGGLNAWLGFATGYGGSPFAGGQIQLVTPDVERGLDAYAMILGLTWTGSVPRTWSMAFVLDVGLVPEGFLITRFPRMPVVATVPATVVAGVVPVGAPDPEAGGLFISWLASTAGQKAVGSVGLRPSLTAVATRSSAYMQSAVTPGQLRFIPGWLSQKAGGIAGLNQQLVTALARDPQSPSSALLAIQRAINE
jgi:ABC-type glycerol-3-phosphate transport system substrate-binding protein